jgi:uncharacterized protein YerC
MESIEIWRNIYFYTSLYKVSTFGRIIGPTGKFLNGTVNKGGYRVICLKCFEFSKTKTLHRIIAEEFLSNPDNKPEINHKDGNKLNNSVDNLEWATRSENYLHAIRQNLRVPSSEIISLELKNSIWEMFENGAKHREIMEKYGISRRTSGRIKKGIYLNGRTYNRANLKI